jgi:hypothetical protein
MKKKKSNNYFTAETEKYIVEYNNSTDPVYRSKIFTEHIYYPFYKLAENIIHTFKFYYTEVEELEDLKHEIVTVLLEDKIHKFDPTNGAKAYSYFGTIVKRWLINYNEKNYKKTKSAASLDNVDISYELTAADLKESLITLSDLVDEWVADSYATVDKYCSSELECKVVDAVLTIFSTRKDISVFKKKALYIYIREITKCDTPMLTQVIAKLKKSFETYYQLKHKTLNIVEY